MMHDRRFLGQRRHGSALWICDISQDVVATRAPLELWAWLSAAMTLLHVWLPVMDSLFDAEPAFSFSIAAGRKTGLLISCIKRRCVDRDKSPACLCLVRSRTRTAICTAHDRAPVGWDHVSARLSASGAALRTKKFAVSLYPPACSI